MTENPTPSMPSTSPVTSIPQTETVSTQQVSTPPLTSSPMKSVPEAKLKSNKLLIFILAFILFVILGLIAVSAWMYLPADKEDDKKGNSEGIPAEATSAPTVPAVEAFSGKYFTTKLPKGWKIVEAENGLGTDMLTEGPVYKGLTGLSILNENDKEVFSMQAVYGVGDTGACLEVAKFADTTQSYLDEVTALNLETSTEAPTVVDLANKTYESYNFLNHSVRRIGHTLYWNNSASADTFNPFCGFSASMIEYTGMKTTSEMEMEVSKLLLFETTVASTATEGDLSKLDGVLENMAYVK